MSHIFSRELGGEDLGSRGTGGDHTCKSLGVPMTTESAGWSVWELGRLTYDTMPDFVNLSLGGTGRPSSDRGTETLKVWRTEDIMMKSTSCAKFRPGHILARRSSERQRDLD